MYFSQQTSHFSSNRASLITLNYFLWLSPLDGWLTSFSGRHSNNQCSIKTNRPWRRQLETVNTRCRSLVRHQLFLVEPHFSNFFWVPTFWRSGLKQRALCPFLGPSLEIWTCTTSYKSRVPTIQRYGPVQQSSSQGSLRFGENDMDLVVQVKSPNSWTGLPSKCSPGPMLLHVSTPQLAITSDRNK